MRRRAATSEEGSGGASAALPCVVSGVVLMEVVYHAN
jgi:hypothetical protein